MSAWIQEVSWLIESNVAVSSDSQYLKINASERIYHLLILCTLLLWVLCQSIEDMSPLLIDVDVIEEIIIHKITI